MSNKLFFNRILDALSDGKIMKSSMALAFRIIGVLSALVGVVIIIRICNTGFSEFMPAKIVIGTIILAITIAVAFFAIFQIWFYRAKSIQKITLSDFVVIPIISILLRTLGEIYLVFGLAISLGGMFVFWLSGSLTELFPLASNLFPDFFPNTGSPFLTGIFFFLTVNIIAFLILALFYFLAETAIVLVTIANNTKILSNKSIDNIEIHTTN